MSSTRLSLAQQIALLEETAPKDFDPEELQSSEIQHEDDEEIANASAARAHYLDVGPSALRKLHDSVADPKYDGKRTTRKQLESDDDDPEILDEEDDSEDDQSAAIDEDIPSQSDASDNEDSPKAPSHHSGSEAPEDLSSTLRKTREEDLKKGKAVSRQIAIWDSLLDARIRMQKSVTAANRLPAPSDIPRFTASPEGRDALHKMLEEALALSDELFELQENLLIDNENIHPPPRKRRRTSPSPSPSAPLSAHTAALHTATHASSALSAALHPHLLTTLAKWSAKITAVAPSALRPARGAFSSHRAPTGAVQQVEDALAPADYAKVLARTRVRRGRGVRVGREGSPGTGGAEQGGAEDAELFDDTDFYQQLLRDVIDSRAGGAGAGADDWLVLQKQKKAKKRVDTKASKGRKLRYEIHEKLQNFMVPVPTAGGWHEEQIDELFASLLGRGFPTDRADPELEDAHEEEEARERERLDDALRGGFRVFG